MKTKQTDLGKNLQKMLKESLERTKPTPEKEEYATVPQQSPKERGQRI